MVNLVGCFSFCFPTSQGSTPKWSSTLSFSDDFSTFLRLLPLLEDSFFSSNSDIIRRRRLECDPLLLDRSGSSVSVWYNWRIIWKQYMARAMKQTIPHIRKRPQKLLSWSRSDSSSAFSMVQALFASHLSWIRWRSPFSESCKMAVDKSMAKGESRGNA